MERPATYADFFIWFSSYHLRGKDQEKREITQLLIVRNKYKICLWPRKPLVHIQNKINKDKY